VVTIFTSNVESSRSILNIIKSFMIQQSSFIPLCTVTLLPFHGANVAVLESAKASKKEVFSALIVKKETRKTEMHMYSYVMWLQPLRSSTKWPQLEQRVHPSSRANVRITSSSSGHLPA
jgi:hypothetical protein